MIPFQPRGHLWLFRAIENVASRYADNITGRWYENQQHHWKLVEAGRAGMLAQEGRLEKDRLAKLGEEAVMVRQRIVNRVHDALMHGDLVALEHRSDGEIVPVPAAWWRRNGIQNEFHNVRDYRSPFTGIVFVNETALDQLFAPDLAAQTAAGEDRLVDRLTKMMCAAPTTPRPKAEVATELKGQPGMEVSGRGFIRAWAMALKQSGATAWSAPGPKNKTK